MIVKKLRVVIEPIETETDKGLTAKIIELNGTEWNLPSALFPRDIRFISALEALINQYNRTNHS